MKRVSEKVRCFNSFTFESQAGSRLAEIATSTKITPQSRASATPASCPAMQWWIASHVVQSGGAAKTQ